jgi:phage shock protein E
MSPYIKLLFTLLILVIGIAIYQLYMIAMDSPHRISSADARKRLAEHKVDLVLDVRTEAERKALGFFPRSIHMPRDRLESDFSRAFPDMSIRVLIYCNTGQRARLATDTLHSMGYTNTKYITGTHLSLMN